MKKYQLLITKENCIIESFSLVQRLPSTLNLYVLPDVMTSGLKVISPKQCRQQEQAISKFFIKKINRCKFNVSAVKFTKRFTGPPPHRSIPMDWIWIVSFIVFARRLIDESKFGSWEYSRIPEHSVYTSRGRGGGMCKELI